ncbi:tyrosine-type recombinase/integrase [Anaerocolumna sp. MB42-C2]|uniref:tyrosine-type recombinase/integrase n=1 Tax=Anaerocolumna sp. MB42-C2 TaxID=3070997 RepID=UPI0027DFF566|nr:site-specific integrase [Anaerocolumna sp. MB42-C2]WMJ87386.1 site-specific integrase [Anaerocolumna sp. MB42-C2]
MKQINLEEKNLLKEYFTCGTMKSDELESIVKEMKKEKVLQKHPYQITPPIKDGGRWMTYIQDTEVNKRVKITSYTEDGIYQKLYNIYFPVKKETLEILYPLWVEKRKGMNLSSRTIQRNRNHWEKYYEKAKIIRKSIDRITVDDIEGFFHGCISEYDLTKKELDNMKLIFKDLMKYAKKKGLILSNPYDDVEIKLNGCKPPNNPKDESRVYLPEEKEKLFRQLNKRLMQMPYETDAYVVFLLFKLGLRIGEAVALKWSDIDWEAREIHIHRMESRVEDENGKLKVAICEYTKKKSPAGDRYLPLSDYEINLFQTVKRINEEAGYSDGDFIFCDKEGRTKIREVDNCIRAQCRRAGIEVKSTHDIRRTVASEMRRKKVEIEDIQWSLGHNDEATTRTYILNNQGKQKTSRQIVNALSGMNGSDVLMRTQNSRNEKSPEAF